LQQKIRDLGSRSKPEIMEKIILEICNVKAYNLDELSKIVNRRPHHIREKFLNLLMKQGKIEYTIPEVINHPKQAYKTIKTSN
jgi:ATP-dependent DNA helicase RecG